MSHKSQQMLTGGAPVSVILPAYNAERYISKCIKSVLSQTYKNLELIIVNDGSTDRTLSICQEFAEKDKRIVIIDKKNEGVGMARYDAVQQAHGEYVTFVDSDDWLTKNAVEVLLDNAMQYDADLVIASSCKYFFGVKIRGGHFTSDIVNRVWTHEELMNKFFKGFFGINITPVTLWGKLYKRHLLKDYFVPLNYKFGEDFIANMKIFPHIGNAVFINDVIYFYRQGSGCTGRFMPHWMEDIKSQYYVKKEELVNWHLEDQLDYYIKVELINCLRTYVTQFIVFKTETREENIAAVQKELQDEIYKELVGVKYRDVEILNAIITRDAPKLYTRVEFLHRHAPFKTKARRIGIRVAKRLLKAISIM